MDALAGTWGPTMMIFGAVALATVATALVIEWALGVRQRRVVVRQLDALSSATMTSASSALLRDTDAEKAARWIEALSLRLPQVRSLAALLDRAGLSWTPQSFVVTSLGLALSAGLGIMLVFPLGLAIAAAAIAAGSIPYGYVRHRARKRMEAFEEQLPEAIDLVGRAMRAGHPLSAGLKMVGDEGQEPLAGQFRRVFEEQRFGMPFDDALMGLTDRVPLTDVRILVTAILVQREVGGNLAEVLDKIAYVIRERFTIKRQIRVYTAQGRFSGVVLALLPIGVGSALFFINREYVVTLFVDPIARYFLVFAVILQVLGYLWIRKIVDVEI
jgi:tight adherence protein B